MTAADRRETNRLKTAYLRLQAVLGNTKPTEEAGGAEWVEMQVRELRNRVAMAEQNNDELVRRLDALRTVESGVREKLAEVEKERDHFRRRLETEQTIQQSMVMESARSHLHDPWIEAAPHAGNLAVLRDEKADLETRLLEMEKRKDAAYDERNRVVAVLARLCEELGWRVGVGKHEPDPDPTWSDDWKTVVYIEIPGAGQCSWHVHDSAKRLFEMLIPYNRGWDGTTTEQKYARLEALVKWDNMDAIAHIHAMRVQMYEDARETMKEAADMVRAHDQLGQVQARCTELLLENHELRAKLLLTTVAGDEP